MNENTSYKLLDDPLWIEYSFTDAVSSTTKTYQDSGEAKHSPLASKIFGFPWVEQMTLSPLSLKIKRQDWVDFDIIAEPLKDLITEHFSALTTTEENPEAPVYEPSQDTKGLSEEAKSIVDFLDSEVNPQVAAHGGRISFIKLEDKKLYLKMEGGCQGCSMAAATLKEGVEKSIVEKFNFVSEVIDTTDHSSGVKPFFQ